MAGRSDLPGQPHQTQIGRDKVLGRRVVQLAGDLLALLLLAANQDRALYLSEICAAIGVSLRTLRVCCHEHGGMGPIRYLWLRRMHLARRALARADPAQTTVAAIATDYGFWELDRFAVAYRKLFGESPSTTLHRPCHERPRLRERPFVLPAIGSA